MMRYDDTDYDPCYRQLAKCVYFLHLVVSAIFTTYIIITHHNVPSFTITFVMLVIYGYMLIWVLLLNFVFILLNKQQTAVCITRILVKFVFFLFPIFGLLSIVDNHFLHTWQIHTFIIYMGVITLLLIMYEIFTCCTSKKYPAYIFEPNDLQEANQQVFAKRREFDETMGHGL